MIIIVIVIDIAERLYFFFTMLGCSPIEEAQVSQWLEYRVCVVDRCADKKQLFTVLEVSAQWINQNYIFYNYFRESEMHVY